MPNIPDKYNTDGLKDLANVWQDLLMVVDGATEKQIYALVENIVKEKG